MFINISNNPSGKWSKEQLAEAEKWGEVVDLPFPNVPASADVRELSKLAVELEEKVSDLAARRWKTDIHHCVLIQGEMGLTHCLVNILRNYRYKCVHACSERVSVEEVVDGQTRKTSVFKFVQFREYVSLF